MLKKNIPTQIQITTPDASMKVLKNYSLQGRSVILNENGVFRVVWLAPKESITVPESQITQQIKNLHKRRLIVIGN
jgi:hypothetical protein